MGFLGEDVGAVRRCVDKPLPEGVRDGADQQQVAHAVEQVEGEAAGLVAGLDDLVDGAVHRASVAVGEGVDGGVEKRQVRHAQQWQRQLVGQAVLAGAGEHLVQNRQGVARRAAACADDQRVDVLVDVDAFFLHHVLHQLAHRLRRQQPERVVVGARADGAQHLLRLGGGEDENQVGWRLLHDLQQGVVALFGDHVGLVDDEDAVARLRRREQRALAQLAHVLHAAVGSGVKLHHVQVAGPARRERNAGFAHAARGGSRPLGAVQGARQDARRGRLSAAARAGKEVGVRDPPVVQGGRKWAGHLLLADDLAERCGAVFPVQSHAGKSSPRWTPQLPRRRAARRWLRRPSRCALRREAAATARGGCFGLSHPPRAGRTRRPWSG